MRKKYKSDGRISPTTTSIFLKEKINCNTFQFGYLKKLHYLVIEFFLSKILYCPYSCFHLNSFNTSTIFIKCKYIIIKLRNLLRKLLLTFKNIFHQMNRYFTIKIKVVQKLVELRSI